MAQDNEKFEQNVVVAAVKAYDAALKQKYDMQLVLDRILYFVRNTYKVNEYTLRVLNNALKSDTDTDDRRTSIRNILNGRHLLACIDALGFRSLVYNILTRVGYRNAEGVLELLLTYTPDDMKRHMDGIYEDKESNNLIRKLYYNLLYMSFKAAGLC